MDKGAARLLRRSWDAGNNLIIGRQAIQGCRWRCGERDWGKAEPGAIVRRFIFFKSYGCLD